MRVSRREFLGGVTGVAVGLATMARSAERRDQSGWGAGPLRGTRLGCVLLDLQDCCGLRESLAGYEAALTAAGVRFVTAALDAASGLPPASVVIVPGCARLHPRVVEELAAALESGAWLLLESGAAFAAPTEFAAHQRALKSQFRLEVDAPVDLWSDLTPETSKSIPARAARGPNALRRRKVHREARVPYVDYAWPVGVRVRDFSRVVPLAEAGNRALGRPHSQVIAWVDRRPVAVRQAVGKGTLVFLGSPLGPALRSGDLEARRWLSAVLSLA